MFLKYSLSKIMTTEQYLMALGDAIGGFAIALLYFSYTGSLDMVSAGWWLVLASLILHLPFMKKARVI